MEFKKPLPRFIIPSWIDMGRLGDQPVDIQAYYDSASETVAQARIFFEGLDITSKIAYQDMFDFIDKAQEFIQAQREFPNENDAYDQWKDTQIEKKAE